MNTVLLASIGLGLGLVGMITAFLPNPAPLADAIHRLHRPLVDGAPQASWRTRAFGDSWLGSSVARRLLASSTSDLRLCGLTPAEHLAQRVVTALIAAAWAPVTAALVAAAGVSVSLVIPLWVSVALAPLGFLLPGISLKASAAAKRRSFRHAFSSFLDIVSVSLAGGKGVEGALNDGADAGDGWAFERIRHALRHSRLMGQTPWRGLSELGAELDIVELRELAASAELAGAEGARVRASISAKARALRLRGLTDIEAEAQSASERMSLPIVGLMVGFVVFLGYPAVMQVIQGL